MLQLGSIPTLVVSSALVTRAIFKVHDIVFSGRPQLHGAKKLSYNFFNISLAPYGEYWREVRKIATLELFSMRKVKSFRFMREEEVAHMLEFIDKGRLNGPVDVSALTLSLANIVTCRAAYGTKTDQNKKFFAVLHDAQQLFIEVNIADVFPSLGWINKFNGVDLKVERCFKELDMFYNQVIEDHRDPSRRELDHDRKDFMDILLDIQRDLNQAIALADDHFKGILMDIFFGGSDTSAATLVWTMTELIKHPKIMKKAQDEVRDIAKGKEYVEESDLPNLHYLQLVLKESFRLHPPAPLLIPRETIEDCEVMGFHIPAKTRVFVNAKAIGLDPECWEDPYRFKPERFLSSSIDFRGQD
ncbi:hypothetical protein Droror1_Dr00004433 [Drosera rotundifolia]